MTREPRVRIEHLSVFPEAGITPTRRPSARTASPVLPWQTRAGRAAPTRARRGIESIYAGYLVDRAESVLAALRLIASHRWSGLVHCAAGKDRTGVVVAVALAEVGVREQAIVEDCAQSASASVRSSGGWSSPRRTLARPKTGRWTGTSHGRSRCGGC